MACSRQEVGGGRWFLGILGLEDGIGEFTRNDATLRDTNSSAWCWIIHQASLLRGIFDDIDDIDIALADNIHTFDIPSLFAKALSIRFPL